MAKSLLRKECLHNQCFRHINKILGLQTPGWHTFLQPRSCTEHSRPAAAAITLILSASKKGFHTSSTAEGYKARSPGNKKWKYNNPHTNLQGKFVPRPANGTQLPRFFLPSDIIKQAQPGAIFQLSPEETKHALRVLRMREGDWLEVCDGRGLIVEAQLKGLNYNQQAFATATTEAVQTAWTGPRWEVVVAMGGLRGGRAETLVEKISEIGAWALRPLLTQRSRTIGKWEKREEVKIVSVEELSDEEEWEDNTDFVATGKLGRWERVARSASKQSLRSHGLILRPPATLEDLTDLTQNGTPAFVAKQGGPPVLEVLRDNTDALKAAAMSEEAKPCMLLVGPEGDFTDEETVSLQEAGAKLVGLGLNRLRVETAAIAMVTAGMLHWETLREKSVPHKKEDDVIEAEGIAA